MKYMIITHDESNDSYIVKLIEQIGRLDFRSEIYLAGGNQLKGETVQIVNHSYVLDSNNWSLKLFLKTKRIKRKILSLAPEVLIFIGFSQMDQKFAILAKKNGIKTFMIFLSALDEKRIVKTVKLNECFDGVLVTTPFDADSLKLKKEKIEYIGNHIFDLVKDHEFERNLAIDEKETNVAVLYDQEMNGGKFDKVLQQLIKASPRLKFHISSNGDGSIQNSIGKLPNVHVHLDKTYNLLKHCNLSITSSGLSSLEATFLNCPQVVVNQRGFSLFKKKKQPSLVNSIAGKNVVKELQTSSEILDEINLILNDQHYCASMLSEYQIIKEKVGHQRASKRAAQIIVDFLESSSS